MQFARIARGVVAWLRGRPVWLTVLAVVLVIAVAAGATKDDKDVAGAAATETPPSPTVTSEATPEPEATAPASPTPHRTASPTAAETATSSPSPTAAATSEPATTAGPRGDAAPVILQGRVVDIVDGDTIDLANGTRVRLAIVDTPEVHGGMETCGPEASDFTGSFLAGQTVAVYRPEAAPQTDSFGRTLGEVVRVVDGASLNVALVRAGLGTIDSRFTGEDPDLAGRLTSAAAVADSPACEPQPEPAPTAAPAPTSVAPPPPSSHIGKTDGGWACHPAYQECLPQGGDLDCADVGHQVHLLGDSDPYRLDGNSTSRQDGLGCESKGPWSASLTYPYY